MVVPAPSATPVAPEGAVVALGQSVRVGALTVTPIRVVEDSRCPINARCVWAGRVVVETRIEGPAADGVWRDSASIRLDESYGTHGHVIVLETVEPGRTTQGETPPDAYRFLYRPGWHVGNQPGAPMN